MGGGGSEGGRLYLPPHSRNKSSSTMSVGVDNPPMSESCQSLKMTYHNYAVHQGLQTTRIKAMFLVDKYDTKSALLHIALVKEFTLVTKSITNSACSLCDVWQNVLLVMIALLLYSEFHRELASILSTPLRQNLKLMVSTVKIVHPYRTLTYWVVRNIQYLTKHCNNAILFSWNQVNRLILVGHSLMSCSKGIFV